MPYKILRLIDFPEKKEQMAEWFHEKWHIPLNAYLDSMNDCLNRQKAIPQWYTVWDNEKIIGGLGVIENDFHNRPDLTPNICAVYVEEAYRCQGIAGGMLEYVCTDMAKRGIHILYLLTNHTSFYERYGWKFVCMVQGDGETELSRMYSHQWR